MKRVPAALVVMFFIFVVVWGSRNYLTESLEVLELAVFNVEMSGGSSASIEELKTVYKNRRSYIMLVGDRDATLQLGVAIDVLNANNSPDETSLHVNYVKAELKRAEELFLSVF